MPPIPSINSPDRAPVEALHNQKKPSTLKCPTCNFSHHPKTDVFGNCRGGKKDYDARELFGVTTTCPICIEECSELVVLKCGHILCKADYLRLGGYVKGFDGMDDFQDDGDDNGTHGTVILTMRKAGQEKVNGTYRKEAFSNRYSKLGSFNGEDAEFSIETRMVDGRKMWYISCQHGSDPRVDFYRVPVNEISNYPPESGWKPASLYGRGPHPRIKVDLFKHA